MKLPKVYEPSQYESDIYALWEKSHAFVPQNRGSDKTYSIVVPPPNANGNLHIGHGLTLALEDIAVRYHRMLGEASLLLPGADHAGFETQVVYEKQLNKTGKSRFDFSREELYQQIWEFVQGNRTNFEAQLRSLGASVDWSRFTFTLDDKIVKRAYSTFKQLWDDKLIYRGTRLVNFCTFHGTAFADIEVEHKEEAGHLWHIRYPLTDGSGEVIVATTRPETMLGDTAVAVHPDDKRYVTFVGKTIKLPLTNREIPILADPMVEQGFGSGAVKITPAHDQNDFDVAIRHDLPMMTVIDNEGNLTHDVPAPYRGLGVEAARKAVLGDLKKQGYLVKTEDYTHNVGHCYKCGTVIQPLLREQWFIDMQPLARPAIAALKANKITFYPASKKAQLIGYLEGLRDWNISRQIAWGIPIPAFQNVDNPDDWIYDETVAQETITKGGKTYRRDPDVFDTWFSSSSWPYATLDYPDGADFEKFFPISVMETGADILYPWVARMIMLGIYTTGQTPFSNVYLHGLVLDEHGAKMSKSKNNVVNPMDKIKQFGSDAFRMGIIANQTPGNNQPYVESRLVAGRNFANKLWNIARYTEDKVGEITSSSKPQPVSVADHWILFKLQQSTEIISHYLDTYRFGEAYEILYRLVWDDFADWYIEASKSDLNKGLLAFGLESLLKLAHPFAPFVTETIWQTLAWEDGLLATSSWPVIADANTKSAAAFEEIKAIVTEVRMLNTLLGAKKLQLTYHNAPLIADNSALITRLSNLQSVTESADASGLMITQSKYHVHLVVDTETLDSLASGLTAKIATAKQVVARLQKRLANTSYVDNAPKHIIEQTKAQLAEAEQQQAALVEQHARFSK